MEMKYLKTLRACGAIYQLYFQHLLWVRDLGNTSLSGTSLHLVGFVSWGLGNLDSDYHSGQFKAMPFLKVLWVPPPWPHVSPALRVPFLHPVS